MKTNLLKSDYGNLPDCKIQILAALHGEVSSEFCGKQNSEIVPVPLFEVRSLVHTSCECKLKSVDLCCETLAVENSPVTSKFVSHWHSREVRVRVYVHHYWSLSSKSKHKSTINKSRQLTCAELLLRNIRCQNTPVTSKFVSHLHSQEG